MIHSEIRLEDIEKARRLGAEMGHLHNSITNGGGNICGFLGEIIVKRYLRVTNTKSTFDFDLKYRGSTFDVKTKRVRSEPKKNYYCSVAGYNIKQDCDYYFFTRVHENLMDGWLLGFISKKDFFKKAIFGKKGDIDPTSDRGWVFKADCYNLPISKLSLDLKKIK